MTTWLLSTSQMQIRHILRRKIQSSTEPVTLIDRKSGTNGSMQRSHSTCSAASPAGAYFQLLIRSFFPSETPFRTTLRTNSAANCRNKWQRGPQRGPDQQQTKRKIAGGDHAQDQHPFRAGLDPYPAGVYNRIVEYPIRVYRRSLCDAASTT